MWGIVQCSLIIHEDVMLEVKLPFYTVRINPFDLKKRELKQNKKLKKIFTLKVFRNIVNVLKSFKVKKVKVDLDTSDVIWNSYLYPVFSFLTDRNRCLNINYNGEIGVLIHIENRLFRMIWFYFK